MKELAIPFLPDISSESSMDIVDKALDTVARTVVGETPWDGYTYAPQVGLHIAYGADAIVLRFSVDEEVAQAQYRNTHDPVHKDSCVEFFVSFDGGTHYYNMEFNCLGTRMMAYGQQVVPERSKLPVSLVESIRIRSSIDISGPLVEQGQWELLLVIPLTVFLHEPELDLSGKMVFGNFYKCGDELPTPHYVSWNHVHHPFPNFHTPKSFGKLVFLER